MKGWFIFLVLGLIMALIVSCSSGISTNIGLVTYSLPVSNSTNAKIDRVEVKSGEHTIGMIYDLFPSTEDGVVFPLVEGKNLVIAYQSGKIAEKPFFVKNGDIREITGQKGTDKIFFRPTDFQNRK